MSVDVVMARFDESAQEVALTKSSFRGYRILVYNAGAPMDGSIPVPNAGQESGMYLQHIIRNYDQLADVTAFIQAIPSDHSQTQGWSSDRYEYVQWYRPLTEACFGSMDDLMVKHVEAPDSIYKRFPGIKYGNHPLRDAAAHLGLESPKSVFSYAAGACFAVPKNLILQRPKEWYIHAFDWTGHAPRSYECCLLERLWPVIFS